LSKDAERDLAAFLAALPSYQRKLLDQTYSSLTQGEQNQFMGWMTATPEQFDALWQEYRRLVERIPAKLREYRKRINREHGAGTADVLGLPKGKPGRKENVELAERIWALDAEGKKNHEIQETLSASGEHISLEAVESYLKKRRRVHKH